MLLFVSTTEGYVFSFILKSGVGIIVDYSRDYTVVNGVLYFFQFLLF